MAWPGLAAAAFSEGDFEHGVKLAQTYGMGATGTLSGVHMYHWYGDISQAYAPAMRLATREGLAESGLSASYRRGATVRERLSAAGASG